MLDHGEKAADYDLEAIKLALGSVGALAMTSSALRYATSLGFDHTGVAETIARIKRRMFYKSMTTFADHRLWQDVYHVPRAWACSLREVSGGRRHRVHGDVVQGEVTMAAIAKEWPDTMVSPETGEVLRRGVRPFLVVYKDRTRTVELPGYYPDSGDDGIHVGDDMTVTDAALRALKEEVEGIPAPATIKRVRQKLKLSQREAGGLLKVGESAFDKYERGLVEPSGPTSQLLRLLDRHPELVEELRQPSV